MPYHYHESTKLSHEDSVALKSLAATGELPKDHYWNALREKHDAHPVRFDRVNNYVLAALLNRDQMQREGILSASSPLFSNTGFFSYAGAKHTLDATRFDHWHPFLGRLFELTLPTTAAVPAGESLTGGTTDTSPALTTPTNIGTTTGTTPGTDSGTGSGDGTTSTGTPSQLLPPSSGTGTGTGTSTGLTPSAVPEPASALMMGIAVTFALTGAMLRRKFQTRPRQALTA